jgi:hypothetical protein
MSLGVYASVIDKLRLLWRNLKPDTRVFSAFGWLVARRDSGVLVHTLLKAKLCVLMSRRIASYGHRITAVFVKLKVPLPPANIKSPNLQQASLKIYRYSLVNWPLAYPSCGPSLLYGIDAVAALTGHGKAPYLL